MSENFNFTVFASSLKKDSDCLPEAQEVVKAVHKYQRKLAGLEIKRGRTETKEETKDKPKTSGKASGKASGKSSGKKAKAPKEDDVRKAFVAVLDQFDKKKELDRLRDLKGRILEKYGVDKLADIDEADRAAFIADCEGYDREDGDNEFNNEPEDEDSILD
jgi:hypothetical protein